MKKKLAKLLAAVLAVSLFATGCGGSGGSGGSGGGSAEESASSGEDVNELHVQRAGTPETIDPALNSTSDGSNIIIHLSEGLLKENQDNETTEGIAKSWEVSDDGLTYTFHLRDGLKWSDGSDLTADDLVYTWKRVADPMTAAPYAYDILNYVKGWDEATDAENPNVDALGVSAPDPQTFVVELSVPCTFFDKISGFAVLMPVKQEAVETGDDWATNPATYISNGPYKLVEYTPGDVIVMEKNENYWDADSITFDRITWHLIEDDNAAYSAFQDGTLDFCFAVPTEEIPGLDGSEEFHTEAQMGTYYINFNNEKEPFDDPKVRKALSLAVDRDYVANTIMLGTYSRAKNFVGPGVSDAKEGSSFEEETTKKYGDHFNVDDYEADLEEAKKLLAEAGYPDGEGFPTIKYATNDTAFHKPVAEYLQSVGKDELGIDMEIDIQEWNTFSADRRAGNFDVARNGWVYDWDDPSNMINLLETSNGNNDGRYSNPEFDKLVEEARNTTDKAEHYEKLHEAEQVMLDDAGCAPLAYYNDFWMQKTNLKGTWHSPYGYYYFMYGSFQ